MIMMTKVLLTFVATIVLHLTYKLLFGKCNRFTICRITILTMSIFAFVFPFISIKISGQMPEYILLPENIDILVETEIVKDNSLSFMSFVALIYIIGVIFSFMKMLFNIHKIHKMKVGKKSEIIDNVNIYYTGESHIPFSFFNDIFIGTSVISPTDNVLSEPVEGSVNPLVLKHEMSHVKNYHSIDVVMMEIMVSLQWFNPFIRMMKKELQSIHEYIADNEVIEDKINKSNYMMLLLQQCTADNINGIANNFSFLLTKKRISMIANKQKSKRMLLRLLLTLPVFGMLIMLNTRCDNVKSNDDKIANAEKNAQDSKLYRNESVDNPVNETTSLDIHTNQSVTDTIYNNIEIMPEFPGGFSELMNFLTSNVNYPESAKTNNIEGRTLVSFVVEKDGSITDIEVLRGFDKDCDAEAVRVVSTMPKWKPGVKDGETVRCRFNLPFTFKIK